MKRRLGKSVPGSPGLGLEKLGRIGARWPRSTALVFLLLAALSVLALARLPFSGDLDQTFRADTPVFHRYDAMRQTYPGSQEDLIIIVAGAALMDPENLARLRQLHLDLQFLPGVRRVTSPFSARWPPDRSGYARPIVPARLAGHDIPAIKAALLRHPMVGDILMSADGRLMAFRISLGKQAADLGNFRRFLRRIKRESGAILEGSGLQVQLTGLPVMRVDVIAALVENQVIFVVTAFLLGMVLAGLMLGSLRELVIVAAPTGIAAILVFGVLWLLGREINGLTILIPTLVIVLTLADSMHLMFAFRREAAAGKDRGPFDAIRAGVDKVGPACVLTSATTAFALLSLLFADQVFINSFADAAALCVLLAFVVSVGLTPAIARLLPGWHGEAAHRRWGPRTAFEGISRGIGRLTERRPVTITALGVVALAAAAVGYAQLEPRYIYRDYLPKHAESEKALQAIDRKMTGTATFRAVIRLPPSARLDSREARAFARTVHETVASLPQIRKVISVDSIRQWQAAGGADPAMTARQWQQILTRFDGHLVSKADHSMLVTGLYTDTGVSSVIANIGAIQATMDDLARNAPAPLRGVRVDLTGVYLVATRTIQETIGVLNYSLILSIIVIIAFIAVVLRSLSVGLITLLPNLLPLAAGGTWLLITDQGLQMTCVIAFIVGFGMSVDSTIHILMRYHRKHDPRTTDSRATDSRLTDAGEPESREPEAGGLPAGAMTDLLAKTGPVIIIASLIMAVGAATTMFSSMQTLSLFGEVTFVILSVALAGDLFVLPAMLVLVARFRQRAGARRRPGRLPDR